MCGFVGFTNNVDNADGVLENMKNKIIHRGPDSDGSYIDDDMVLGFRRLSIIDIKCGDQPMFNEDKTLALVFNGEIYNFKKLKDNLKLKGHVFANNSDSEVLIHGYEEYGCEFVKKLRGMFSFVLWDKKNKTLFGARDPFGIKPLYYTQMNGSFIFGSELKGLIPHPHFKQELNSEALEHYLSFQYSIGPESFFKNVFRLPPGHYFKFKNNKLSINRYFDVKFNEDTSKSLEQWVDDIEYTFDNSVNAHKIADVEVGSFLSSGVDSSYVACSANVDKTFTVGFSEHQYNEIDYAKTLSDEIGVKNINKVIKPEEFWDTFPKIQYFMDEPLADASAVALYFVCNLASQYVKVVLSGEGADEIFGGYNVYKDPVENSAYDKIPYFLRHALGSFLELFPPKRGLNFFVRHGKRIEDRFIGNAYIYTKKERQKVLKSPIGVKTPNEVCKPYYNKVSKYDQVTKMQYIDLNFWLAGDILLKADRMSMANSLELRVPFLDKEIIKLAQTIPLKYRVNSQNTKYALRVAAMRRMPKQVADKKKLGFPVPIRLWLKQDKYYNMVKSKFQNDVCKRYFNEGYLLKLLDDHKRGKKDNSRKIWTVYSFLVWFEQYF